MRTFILQLILIVTGLCSQSQVTPLKVPFIDFIPVIDGYSDLKIQTIPLIPFNTDSGENNINPPQAGFRIAYGCNFLYICAEIFSDTLICRDRGYQNGDGMILMIAKPVPGGLPSNEFYEMGFTARENNDDGKNNWQSKFIWYRNAGLVFSRLPEASFSARQSDHKVVMELLLHWSEIYPFHPWISKEIGINLSLVKASGTNEKIRYGYIMDTLTGSEQNPRNYALTDFSKPVASEGVQSYAILRENHIQEGQNLVLRIAAFSDKKENVSFRTVIRSGENAVIKSKYIDESLEPGLNLFEKDLPATDLLTGGYQVSLYNGPGNSSGTLYFSVLSPDVVEDLNRNLEVRKNSLTYGSYTTLKFLILNLESGITALKEYETAYTLRIRQERLKRILESNEDLIQNKKGLQRRGFLSKIDSTYRPYTVKVPENYDKTKKYPLLVFLHGSAQDDQGVLEGLPKLNLECIQLAPNGRGTSNCYTTDFAQDDIGESIQDVILYYAIDTTKIILAGFSMGGYGVYRTYYEHPSRYKALIVFSGSPDLATRWIGPGQPDFLNEKYLVSFKNAKLFIFHGTVDFNVPIDNTKVLVEKLRKSGADVTFVTEPVGHESPGSVTVEKLNEWLDGFLTDSGY